MTSQADVSQAKVIRPRMPGPHKTKWDTVKLEENYKIKQLDHGMDGLISGAKRPETTIECKKKETDQTTQRQTWHEQTTHKVKLG